MKCEKCNGTGNFGHTTEIIEINYQGMNLKVPGLIRTTVCTTCFGKGELDWVEVIIGVDEDWRFQEDLKLLQEEYYLAKK